MARKLDYLMIGKGVGALTVTSVSETPAMPPATILVTADEPMEAVSVMIVSGSIFLPPLPNRGHMVLLRVLDSLLPPLYQRDLSSHSILMSLGKLPSISCGMHTNQYCPSKTGKGHPAGGVRESTEMPGVEA